MINKNLVDLKKIILSGSNTGREKRPISLEECISLFETNYSYSFHNYKVKYKICRGDRSLDKDNDIYWIKPNKRFSENTDLNFYTTLFSEVLPSWSKYPKRNNSIICTTSTVKASNYSDDIYFVFPKNDAKIGICPKSDIWVSFSNFPLNEFENIIEEIINKIDYSEEVFDKIDNDGFFNTKEDILNFFDYFSKNVDKLKDKFKNSIYQNKVHLMIENKDNLLGYFNSIFDPVRNNFKLQTIEEFNVKNNNEVWFSNESIFVYEYYMDQILRKMLKNE